MGWLSSLSDLISRLLSGPGLDAASQPIAGTGGDLSQAWRAWQDMRRPETVAAVQVDLREVDRQLSPIFATFFEQGALDTDTQQTLEMGRDTLARVVPMLSGEARQYFAMELAIARGISENEPGLLRWQEQCTELRAAILAGERPMFTARAAKDGESWYIEIGGVPRLHGAPGAFTQARKIEEIEQMAREVTALVLDVPKDSFDLTIRRRG